MASSEMFQCTVITPEQKVLECDATFVAFPAHDGEMGVLTRRSPLVCKMGIGTLRIESPDEKHTLFVDGGFAQVLDNRLTILTQQAKSTDQIDGESARQSLIEARAMKITDDKSYTARDNAIRRAGTQIKLTRARK